jgi:pimeloyl-ACP methyl ester carboxylesterase
MTSEHLQHTGPRQSTLLAATAVGLACGLFVLSTASRGEVRTISGTESFAVAQASSTRSASEDRSIRLFKVQVPQAALDDLRRRINVTRWPDKETVADRSQGTQLAKLQELVRYWGTDYDWRKVEAKLNALPQFITTIDGLDIHFIHVRSRHPNALPVIVTHGWPGSVTEQLKLIGPLTDPAAHGARAEDAFDVVIPSMPGYGFSGKPTATGWNPDRIARAWAELMKRLGYTRYVAQGGDWGSPISSAMARQGAAGLLGIHINLPATVPPDVAAVLASGGPAPAGLSEKERAAFDSLDTFYKKRRAYGAMMGTRPQVIGQALTDSPAGLAAFMYDYNNGEPERLLAKDDFLDNVTLYWLTNTATSSARLYWETGGQSVILAAAQKTSEISLPVAITVFPEEVYRAPETWARRAYRNLIYFNEVDKGGHFAAWEQPELLAAELRAAFRSLRPAH